MKLRTGHELRDDGTVAWLRVSEDVPDWHTFTCMHCGASLIAAVGIDPGGRRALQVFQDGNPAAKALEAQCPGPFPMVAR